MNGILEVFNTLMSNEIIQNIFKILLAAFLSGFIGYEREHSGKPAGFRTYVLVGVSAVLVMLCNMKLTVVFGNNDPSRMPAQLLSGIGFIGAGTILSNGFKVKGLTTATAILAVTCIGLGVGAGLYGYAILATAIVYVVLRYSHFFGSIDYMNEFKFRVLTDNPKDTIEIVNEIIEAHEMDIKKVTIVDKSEKHEGCLNYYCKVADSSFNKNLFVTQISKADNVKQIQEL